MSVQPKRRYNSPSKKPPVLEWLVRRPSGFLNNGEKVSEEKGWDLFLHGGGPNAELLRGDKVMASRSSIFIIPGVIALGVD